MKPKRFLVLVNIRGKLNRESMGVFAVRLKTRMESCLSESEAVVVSETVMGFAGLSSKTAADPYKDVVVGMKMGDIYSVIGWARRSQATTLGCCNGTRTLPGWSADAPCSP